MAREKGIFHVSANYEPLKAAPFDARSLVECKADLTNPETWIVNGTAWIYDGMIVSVGRDVNAQNNGVYMLKNAKNYTLKESWEKLADDASIKNLQNQIDEINTSAGAQMVEVATETDLPLVGNVNVLYFVLDEKTIWKWQEETQSYICYSGSQTPTIDINIIYGGDSNGNTTD